MNKEVSTDNNQQSKRAKARWAILRKALLQSNSTSNSTTHDGSIIKQGSDTNIRNGDDELAATYSIHRFQGFNVFKRSILVDTDINLKYDNTNDYYELAEYEIPIMTTRNNNHASTMIKIRTREKTFNVGRKVSIKDLMSHVYYGVDNTGNTRVWNCSNVLAHLVTCPLSLPSSWNDNDDGRKNQPVPFVGLSHILSLSQKSLISGMHRLRVIELGAGMAALPSLSLAAISLSKTRNKYIKENMPFMDIVITDGHPNSVENNLINAKLTFDLYDEQNIKKGEKVNGITDDNSNSNQIDCIYSNSSCSIQCTQLLWKANDQGSKECLSLLKTNQQQPNDFFDLVLVSDCTHFTECHAGLIATIGRLLRVHGVCLLCQPMRGNTLDQFIEMVQDINNNACNLHSENENCTISQQQKSLFDLNLYWNYDEHICRQHKIYSMGNKGDKVYDENIHRPLVLVLKKLRDYNEDIDTPIAMKHSLKREAKRV